MEQKKLFLIGAYLLGVGICSCTIQSSENLTYECWNTPTSSNVFSSPHAQNPLQDKTDMEYRTLDEEYIKIAKRLKSENNAEGAIQYYKKAAKFNPHNLSAHFELAGLLYNEGNVQEALEYYTKTVEINPACHQAFYNTSLCYSHLKEQDQAIEYLKKAIEINPHYQKAYKQLGTLLQKEERHEEAITFFSKTLEYNPSLDTSLLIGRSFKALDKLDEATKHFRNAVNIDPNSTIALLELANMLNMRCKNEEDLNQAVELYKRALERDPDLNSARYNIAYTLKRLDRVQEAMEYYNQVLKRNPDYPQARFSLGLAQLVTGDFDNGWKEYEYRWQAYKETPVKFDQPLWDGTEPTGKRILLCAEQGLGDTYQFIRYAQILKRLGATVIVQTQKPLCDILGLCPYIDQLIPRGKPLPQFDTYAHLMSLPLLFKTTVDTVPDTIPYLMADKKLVQLWKERLSHDKNFKIGICWQGNRFYRTQALQHAVAAKSMHPKEFKPLAEIPGVTLYSLQKMCGENQLNEIDFTIKTFGPDLDETHGRFMDTAAIMRNLDLIITVDTSICHLAAGLGVPVWNMLPKPADWRWLLKTSRTPWYPNMRLFRQTKIGDWSGLMKEVSIALIDKLGKECPHKKVNTSKINKSIEPIQFQNVDTLLLEDILDNLLFVTLQYELTRDPKWQNEIKKFEQQINELAVIYNNAQVSKNLEQLTDQLYHTNKQLILIDQALLKLDNKSIFNKDFVDLTRQAQYIHNLKNNIKAQIKKEVAPK